MEIGIAVSKHYSSHGMASFARTVQPFKWRFPLDVSPEREDCQSEQEAQPSHRTLVYVESIERLT